MVELIAGLDAERVRANLARIAAEIEQAARRRPPAPGGGRAPGGRGAGGDQVRRRSQDMPTLAQGGVRLVGENRAQDLQAKVGGARASCSNGTSSASCRAAGCA